MNTYICNKYIFFIKWKRKLWPVRSKSKGHHALHVPVYEMLRSSRPTVQGWGHKDPSASCPLSSQRSEVKLWGHSSGTSSHQHMLLLMPWFPPLRRTAVACSRPFIEVFKRRPAVEEVSRIPHLCLELSLGLANCLSRFISWRGAHWAGFLVNPLLTATKHRTPEIALEFQGFGHVLNIVRDECYACFVFECVCVWGGVLSP